VTESLEAAIDLGESAEIMVIGGGELYRQALPLARRMVLTLVDCSPDADTWFPEWDRSAWKLVSQRDVSGNEENPLSFQVQEWVRPSPS
jgi:dihydrofolate reductase